MNVHPILSPWENINLGDERQLNGYRMFNLWNFISVWLETVEVALYARVPPPEIVSKNVRLSLSSAGIAENRYMSALLTLFNNLFLESLTMVPKQTSYTSILPAATTDMSVENESDQQFYGRVALKVKALMGDEIQKKLGKNLVPLDIFPSISSRSTVHTAQMGQELQFSRQITDKVSTLVIDEIQNKYGEHSLQFELVDHIVKGIMNRAMVQMQIPTSSQPTDKPTDTDRVLELNISSEDKGKGLSADVKIEPFLTCLQKVWQGYDGAVKDKPLDVSVANSPAGER